MVTEKVCSKCSELKDLEDYNKQKAGKYGRRSYCRKCQSIMSKAYHSTPIGKANRKKNKAKYYKTKRGKYTKKLNDARYYLDNMEAIKFRARCREKHVLRATPSWCDKSKLREIYKNRPEGYHVDHIIPLRGANVSGLHIPENLQYLTAEENLSKGNKYVQ